MTDSELMKICETAFDPLGEMAAALKDENARLMNDAKYWQARAEDFERMYRAERNRRRGRMLGLIGIVAFYLGSLFAGVAGFMLLARFGAWLAVKQ